jgi:hypothetical protein
MGIVFEQASIMNEISYEWASDTRRSAEQEADECFAKPRDKCKRQNQ